jgi:hypothetical protein
LDISRIEVAELVRHGDALHGQQEYREHYAQSAEPY